MRPVAVRMVAPVLAVLSLAGCAQAWRPPHVAARPGAARPGARVAAKPTVRAPAAAPALAATVPPAVIDGVAEAAPAVVKPSGPMERAPAVPMMGFRPMRGQQGAGL